MTIKDNAKPSYNKLKIESAVLAQFGHLGIFNSLQSRMVSTAVGLDNHVHDLVRTLISTYFNLRMHEIARRHNLLLQGDKVRSRCTKLVLFKGQ